MIGNLRIQKTVARFYSDHRKLLRFIIPALFLCVLLVWTISGYERRLSTYFFYMSLACTLVPLPTPPVVIGMGEFYAPWLVALVGAIGNCLAAFVEYYLIKWLMSDTKLERRVKSSKTFQRFAAFFQKSAFLCLVFTGFTPIPFEPFRLAAILISYAMPLYLVAIFIGRFSHYFVMAKIGDIFHVPMWVLVAGFILLTVLPLYHMILHRTTDN